MRTWVSRNYISIILSLLISFCFVAILIDSFKNPDSFQKLTGLDSGHLLFTIIIISFVSKLIVKNISIPFYSFILKFIFPISAIIAITLSLIDFLTPANFVFSTLHLNYERFTLLSIGSGIISLIFANPAWIKKNYTKIIFFSGLIILFLGLLMSTWPFEFFVRISEEDNFIEYLQFFTLLTGTIFSFFTSFQLLNNKNRLYSLLFFLIGIGLLFVTGDEISWGQRIIGIETPERVKSINYQEEFNWHNIGQISKAPQYAYIAVGAWGAFSWLIASIIRIKNKNLHFLAPHWYLFVYFFIGFAYNLRISLADHTIGVYSEYVELMLYLGFTLFILENYGITRNLLKLKFWKNMEEATIAGK